jgi:hypothetical protein
MGMVRAHEKTLAVFNSVLGSLDGIAAPHAP